MWDSGGVSRHQPKSYPSSWRGAAIGIYRLNAYRSPNIGIYLRAGDSFLLAPTGLAQSKVSRFSKMLGVMPVQASISGSRLLGPLVVMNSRGILVSRLADGEEIASLRRIVGIPVEAMDVKYTCVGNLIAANDAGAIASASLPSVAIKAIRDVLDVPVETMSIASYVQVGSMVVATNHGGVVHPRASEAEVATMSDVLKVSVEPCTINGGVPFISSGLLANTKGAVVGSQTSGPELVILARALGL